MQSGIVREQKASGAHQPLNIRRVQQEKERLENRSLWYVTNTHPERSFA